MRILVLHCDYFGDLWREAGHETITCGDKPTHDLMLPGYFVTIDSILSELGPSRVPDVIFWGDDSRFVRVLGLEHCPIPKVMWSVDAHQHADWHMLYSQVFDLVFVAQSDYLASFHEAGVPAEWLPLYTAPQPVGPAPAEKLHDVSFVGTLDRMWNPERVIFINQLRTRVPLHVTNGPYVDTFRRSKIVLNQTARGDLNFRVFEALACGSLLLTERTTNGLLDLFTEDIHLATYPRGDVDAATAQVERHLADDTTRERIAAAGREEVERRHLRSHRAEFLLQALGDLVTGHRPRHTPTEYTVDVSMSLMYLHLCHRRQLWLLLVGQTSEPSREVGEAQRLRQALAVRYLELARRHLDVAAARSPEDPLWQEVAALIETQYRRGPELASGATSSPLSGSPSAGDDQTDSGARALPDAPS